MTAEYGRDSDSEEDEDVGDDVCEMSVKMRIDRSRLCERDWSIV